MANDLDQIKRLLSELAALVPNIHLKRLIFHLRERILTPMTVILELVPGDTKRDKAKAIGVSRTCYWQWQVEESRPTAEHARKISRLTGIPASVITATNFEEHINDVGTKVRAANPRVAADGEGVPARAGRKRGAVQRVATQRRERGGLRKVRKRVGQSGASEERIN
jgi:DNA-binding XRE family transcriptional regulator